MTRLTRDTPSSRQVKKEQEKIRLDKLEADIRRVDADVKELKRKQREMKQ